ncbi:GNAT family N-acetyltransferase [Desulfosporosinus lacus]|uniref:Ribosomal protein S18 acetylase RimI n=1 Tax=Desulfosporosinus lacus DSM 15449 TaxID=1121420 RepID=A0A1M5UQW4_9FIRM|nr:GNAT family N-acetyltransferase [Desulfosporosinus lacus]SHH65306.1 Ribosomal protein S18 acetylase RimI [Desulfosporosinus lacus DSM 15449]
MRVRQGNVRDWPFIYALGKIGIPESISPWRRQSMEVTLKYREEYLRGFWTWIEQSESKVFIVEEPEQDEDTSARAIGYLVLHGSSREELTGITQGWIMDIVVLPEWRGKGAGQVLLKAAEDYCREHEIPYLGLAVSSHNVKALRLYENFGFAEERKLLVKNVE